MTSPQAVDALLDAYADQRRALRRVLALVACHADDIANDPALVLAAMDAGPRSVAWCPPGCGGACEPDRGVWARYNALDLRRDHY